MNARRLTVRELAEGKGQVSPHIYAEECPIVLQCTEVEFELIFTAVEEYGRHSCLTLQCIGLTEAMRDLR